MNSQLCPSEDQFWILFAKKLAREASVEELDAIQSFLINHPDLQHQADLITAMWTQTQSENTGKAEAAYMRHIMKHKNEFFPESLPAAMIFETEQPTEKPGSSFRKIFLNRKRSILSFGVLLIVISVAVVYFFIYKSNSHIQESQAISSVVTKNGNRTKIVLPDGTQVWLNAGSKLDYNNALFNKDIREVILNGEAYFDVTKNKEKPFIIHTRKMDIKVLGTAFNVRSYNDEKFAEAALIRGSIEVSLKDRKNQQPIILSPNEKISISTEEIQNDEKKNLTRKAETTPIPQILVKKLEPNPKINIISEIAWTQSKLYLEDESLENIALILERWFGKKIVITNDDLKDLHYYGNFENETLEQVLLYLKLSKPFNFRMDHDSVTIY